MSRYTWLEGDLTLIKAEGGHEEKLAQIDWPRIENYIGLGNEQAPVVFVGSEEGFRVEDGENADEKIVDELVRRSGRLPVTEISAADVKGKTPTWSRMAQIMLAYQGGNPADRDAVQGYIRQKLGKYSGDSLLREFWPYPSRSERDWYSVYKSRYRSREEYRSRMLVAQKDKLRQLVLGVPRSVVAAYSKGIWTSLEDIYKDAQWNEKPLQGGSSVKWANYGPTLVLLSHHFVSPRMRSNAAHAELWSIVSAHRDGSRR